MEFAKLVLRCLGVIALTGALLCGAAAFVSPETFTLGHPPVFGNLPAPLLGLIWGALEFMTPGVVIGLALANAANAGHRPAIKAMFFRKPLWAHAALIAVIGIIGGLVGWYAVARGHWPMVGKVAFAVAPERHALLGAVWWATRAMHVANYAGGIVLAVWTWKKRGEFDALVKAQGGH